MYRSLLPRANLDSWYWKRKIGGKWLINVEECVRTEKNKLRILPGRTRTKTKTATNRSST